MATPRIVRVGPVPRQEGVQTPDLLTPSEWVDAVVLAAGVAETYALPVDAAGNRGTILRLAANAGTAIYYKWDGAATIPAADVSDGSASISARIDMEPIIIAAPNATYNLSLICSGAIIITIEVWN